MPSRSTLSDNLSALSVKLSQATSGGFGSEIKRILYHSYLCHIIYEYLVNIENGEIVFISSD